MLVFYAISCKYKHLFDKKEQTPPLFLGVIKIFLTRGKWFAKRILAIVK